MILRRGKSIVSGLVEGACLMNAMNAKNYDLGILGGGPGGYTAAIRAAQLGMSVALIERENMGGTCLNIGCIPSKALINAATLYNEADTSKMMGVTVSGKAFDWVQIQKYRERCVIKLRKGVESLMRKNKIDVINGHGVLINLETLDVDGVEIGAKHIILATGSTCRDLPSLPVDGVRIINSTHALSMSELPKSILIVGAGAIGCEFAYVLSSLGADVTLVEFLERPLPMEDADISSEYVQVLKHRKTKLHTDCSVERVDINESGVRSTVAPRNGGDKFTIVTEKVLVSVGRSPLTKNCGFETVGIPMNGPFIKIDGLCRTGIGNIMAIGDVTGGLMLAHKASAEGILAVETIAGIQRKPLDMNNIPRATYSKPEVGSVGLTELQAREKFGGGIKVGKFPFSASGKAFIIGEGSGFAKLISTSDGKLIGAHVVGPEATDLIATASTAITLGATVEQFSHIVQAHPTLSEAWHEASHGLIDGTLNF